MLIGPSVSFDGNLYTLTPGATVTLLWAQAPLDAMRIEFYLLLGSTEAEPTLITTDLNPADGASGSWVVPTAVIGYVNAVAFTPDGAYVSSNPVGVYSE